MALIHSCGNGRGDLGLKITWRSLQKMKKALTLPTKEKKFKILYPAADLTRPFSWDDGISDTYYFCMSF